MISVIIPTLNERRALPETLDNVLGQAGTLEVVVADGGSSDGTLACLPPEPRVRAVPAPRGRAAQMNAGAEHARGDWLVFLHADTRLPPGGLAAIAALPEETHWGAFRHRFAQRDWRLQAISWAHNAKCRWNHVFYGDQAIFVRAALFRQAGGFPPLPALEDVAFCERLRRHSRPAFLAPCALTDGRRFLRHGVLRSTARALHALARHRLGLPQGRNRFFDEVR